MENFTKLNINEGCFKVVWENAVDAMALCDENGVVLAANPAYQKLYGYPPEEIIGNKFLFVFSEEMRKNVEVAGRESRIESAPVIFQELQEEMKRVIKYLTYIDI